jgi:hypothetical protein
MEAADPDKLDGSARPILLYLTRTDSEVAKKVETWELAQLSKDEVIIGIMAFDCYMVDADTLEEQDVILQKVGKHKAPGFYTFHGGNLLYKAEGMPKSGAIFTCLKKTVKKVYNASLDKVVKKVRGIEKDIEKVEARRTLLQQKLARLKDDDKSRPKVLAEIDGLLEQESELKKEIDDLMDLGKKEEQVSKS